MRGAARRAEADARSAWRAVAKSVSKESACAGAPCSSITKIEPPSSLTTTIVRSGRGSCGPSISPLASCRNVTSPIRARLPRAVRASQGRADRGGDHPVDPGQPAVRDDLAPIPHGYFAPSGRGRGSGWRRPRPADRRGYGAADRTRHFLRRQLGLGAAVGPACAQPRRRPATRISQAGSRGSRPAVRRHERRRGAVVRAMPRPPALQISMSERASRRLIGRHRVGWPATTTRSIRDPSSPSRRSR